MIKDYTNVLSETTALLGEQSVIHQSRVLIIDDLQTNVVALNALLEKYCGEVLTATSATKGLVIAEAAKPDLILLDVMMPEMNGFEVLEQLKKNKRTADIPVIFITATGDRRNMVKGFEMGVADYITKPFHELELMARVKNHLKLSLMNEHTKALFNSKSHLFITLNSNFEIVNFNASVDERNFLFTYETLRTGENVFNFIDTNEIGFVKKRIENALKGKIVQFEKEYTVNNKTRWFNYIIEPIKNEQGDATGCIISGTDITTKKESEIEDVEYMRKVSDLFEETQQSLRYAGYIQKSIFHSEKDILKQFTDSFVFLKAKAKVSGDFYWTQDLGNKSFVILGDCTGHGVPGALLTTISIVLLERIVMYQGIHSPEKILSELNDNIVSILNQKDGKSKDGLEMAVCLIDKKKRIVEFAGAKRPLLVVNGDELTEIKGDRQDIGGTERKKYTKQKVKFQKNSTMYIFSDGYADQIGGQREKKFMKKNFVKLIITAQSKNMREQKKLFYNSFNEWKGQAEQTDDVSLIGIRF